MPSNDNCLLPSNSTMSKTTSAAHHEYSVDLTCKTKPELLDLLERQQRILSNKKFLEKLPDKGAKVKQLKCCIEEAITKVDEIDNVANVFAKLDVKSERAHCDRRDQEADVLSVLASNGKSSKTFIDLREISSNVCHTGFDCTAAERMTQSIDERHSNDKIRLQFNRSKTAGSSYVRTKRDCDAELWIETEVTPPPATFTESKVISLRESYKLQTDYNERQKELAIEHAAQQLAERMSLVSNSEVESFEGESFKCSQASPTSPCNSNDSGTDE